MLRALGVRAEYIPPGVEEQAALYRSKMAEIGKPVLVIADNASTEAQVRPLLPGSGPHKVLVTSRHTLAGLDARLVDVTVLDEQAAVSLLEAALRAGRPEDDRITVCPQAATLLARVCGGLPLALQITAAMLKADPELGVTELAEELGGERERLGRLRYQDGSSTSGRSVEAAFELSYRRLDDAAARVFRLLPINPGPDISTAAAAALACLPAADVRGILADLARAHGTTASGRPAGRGDCGCGIWTMTRSPRGVSECRSAARPVPAAWHRSGRGLAEAASPLSGVALPEGGTGGAVRPASAVAAYVCPVSCGPGRASRGSLCWLTGSYWRVWLAGCECVRSAMTRAIA